MNDIIPSHEEQQQKMDILIDKVNNFSRVTDELLFLFKTVIKNQVDTTDLLTAFMKAEAEKTR